MTKELNSLPKLPASKRSYTSIPDGPDVSPVRGIDQVTPPVVLPGEEKRKGVSVPVRKKTVLSPPKKVPGVRPKVTPAKIVTEMVDIPDIPFRDLNTVLKMRATSDSSWEEDQLNAATSFSSLFMERYIEYLEENPPEGGWPEKETKENKVDDRGAIERYVEDRLNEAVSIIRLGQYEHGKLIDSIVGDHAFVEPDPEKEPAQQYATTNIPAKLVEDIVALQEGKEDASKPKEDKDCGPCQSPEDRDRAGRRCGKRCSCYRRGGCKPFAGCV